MKTLYLVRHAKSGKDFENITDTDRPLNERGYHDAHLMGKNLLAKKIKPDLLVSSPAIRALTTALIFAQQLNYSEEKILLRKNLYETSVGEHVDVIAQTDNHFNSLMIFGHNPTFSQTVAHLLQKQTEEMPTCAVAGISFNIARWKEITTSKGELILFISPKIFS
jgi:phosphohistidine phosphatase